MNSNGPSQISTHSMELRWVRYLSEVDGRTALITVDQSLREECQATHPYMGWIRLGTVLENATDSVEETLLLFSRFAPDLFTSLANFPTHLAGYIVERNEVTLIFYSQERIRLLPVLRAFLRAWRQWTIRPGQIKDEAWETYSDLLFPNHWEQKELRYFSSPI